jgi:uncharacterized protein (TIGR02444 family)
MLQCDNPFWRFSLAVYAAPGVAPECLALQDTRGIDVNMLLFCAWLGSLRVVLTGEDLAAVEATVRSWREQVVQPLRGVRRDIKARPDAVQVDIAALRKDVAALELRAEQIEQAMLYAMAAHLNAPAATMTVAEAIRRNVSLLLAGGDGTEPARLIEAALVHAGDPTTDRGETKACV